MKWILHALVLLATIHGVIAAPTPAQQQREEAHVADEPILDAMRDDIIVRAEVVQLLGHEGGMAVTREKIVHHYSGQLQNADGTFVIQSGIPAGGGAISGGGSLRICPELEVGEETIWVLRLQDETLRVTTGGKFGTKWPGRRVPQCSGAASFGSHEQEDESQPNFTAVKQLAESAEAVWTVDREERRLKLVIEAIKSDVPEVAHWGVTVLSNSYPDQLSSLGSKWRPNELSFRTVIAIDEALSGDKSANGTWQEKRHSILEELSEAIDDDDDAIRLVDHLSGSIQRKDIASAKFLELVLPMTTAEHSQEVRLRAIAALRWVMNSDSERDAVLDLLIALVDSEHPDRIQLQAAYTISTLKNASGLQLARLAVLRDKYMQLAHQQPPSDPNEPPRKQSAVKQIADMLDQTIETLHRQGRDKR